MVKESGYPVDQACAMLHISRSAYYKWNSGKLSPRQKENEEIADKLEQMHMDEPEKGYRRLRDDLEVYHGIPVNDKRVLRICRKRGIKSTIKYANNGCTRQAKNPQYIAENLLNRDFHAEKPNEKWLTDVTEFKWYEGIEVRSESGTITHWYLIPLIWRSLLIPAQHPCSTATETTSTPTVSFTRSWRVPV